MFSCIQRNDWIIIITNVTFFMVVQTLFFKFVASEQYVNVLKSKIHMVKTYLSKDKEAKEELMRFKQDYINANKEKALEQKALRDKVNVGLTRTYAYNLIALAVIALIGIVLFIKSNIPWNRVYTLSLFLVLLGYTTELFFFFFIVQKYEFIGDQYIISHVASKTRQLVKNEDSKSEVKFKDTVFYQPFNKFRGQYL